MMDYAINMFTGEETPYTEWLLEDPDGRCWDGGTRRELADLRKQSAEINTLIN